MALFIFFVAIIGHKKLNTPTTVITITDSHTSVPLPVSSEKYSGYMLGVSCDCTLYRNNRYASLTLSGIPIGGRLSGLAWFQNDRRTVVLDPELKQAVARRRTEIQQAYHNFNDDTLHIILKLPVFGTKSMILYRNTNIQHQASL
jgi:hypothetical protein